MANGKQIGSDKCGVAASGCCTSECGVPCSVDVVVLDAMRFSVVPSSVAHPDFI